MEQKKNVVKKETKQKSFEFCVGFRKTRLDSIGRGIRANRANRQTKMKRKWCKSRLVTWVRIEIERRKNPKLFCFSLMVEEKYRKKFACSLRNQKQLIEEIVVIWSPQSVKNHPYKREMKMF
ncbi:AAEL017344-PA [Aedes aegypti]|uniref:AAEL017344-PA n=1 Tax=Aedes aegypti TaxID=7159 RepID=J9HTT2_AEDAE|nr:AAEL017344-PA [Aedes aegypti]